MKTGHTPDRSQPDYWRDCDIPWFTLADVWQLRDDRQTHLLETKECISRLGLQNSAAELLPAGTVVFSRTASIGFSGIMPQPMATTQDFWNWIPGPRLLSEYLLQTFRAMRPEFERLAFGSTHRTIYQPEAADLRICVPPLDEQRLIADFLARETGRLDALVAAKERVLGLLVEKRRALVTRAVTRGLDASAPLRDSRIPWLGEVPAHWELTRLKFVAEVRGGLTLGKSYGGAELVEYPYLRVANVQDGHLDLTAMATVRVPQPEARTTLLQPGDVLMNEGGDADKVGRGCVWRGEINPCLHQNHVFAVRPHRVSSEWLDLWTSADVAKAYFESRARQSTNLASISATNIKELPMPLPPIGEREAILAYVAVNVAKLDALRSATERTIALLKERRAALITAAVTGKIDVGRAERASGVVPDEGRRTGRPR